MLDSLRRLGAALEDGWRDADRDEERFGDVAALALEEVPVHRGFEREALLEALLDPHEGGRQQLAPVGAFGQPGTTVFHGDGFVIEIYYWLDSSSAIHNHPFCGVFTVLDGWSVHARYKLSRASRAGARGQLLDVWLAGLELVEPGQIERFSLRRHPLVHALVHVPVPTVSMVVRTTRTEGYFRYLPPSLALPMEPPGEPMVRRLALLESMIAAGEPSAGDHVRTFLSRADFESALHLLSNLWPRVEPTEREPLLEAIAPLHGDRVHAVRAALNRGLRLQQATSVRASLENPDHRLCATALAYAESRDHVLRLLEQRDADGVERLQAFADAVFTADDEQATRTIAGVLIEGQGADAALTTLEATYGPDAVAEQREEVQRFCAESIFSVLAVS